MTEQEATAHITALQQKLALYDSAFDATSCGITISDARLPDMPLIFVNAAFISMSGYASEEIIGKNCRFLQGEDRSQEGRYSIRQAINEGTHCQVLLKNYRKDGSYFWNDLIISPIHNASGKVTHFIGVQNDVTDREDARRETALKQVELEKTLDTLQETQSMLVHSEKMNALGQMVAGVAHEINNPVAFVSSNMYALKQMTNDLKEAFEQLKSAVDGSANAELIALAAQINQEADIDFISEDLNDLIDSSATGLKRVKDIVANLRNFSRLDEAEVKVTVIKECVESTLEIASSVIKDKLTVHLQLDDIAPIKCRPSELNQVFLNLIMNAAYAATPNGTLTITGIDTPETLTLTFTDNGSGMDEATCEKVFNPFFTTKPVGDGTGLGLSIAYKIITNGHGGSISVDSQLGKGTTFTIIIPRKNQTL